LGFADEQGKKDAEDKEKEKAEAAAAAVESQQPVPESSQPMTVSGTCICSQTSVCVS